MQLRPTKPHPAGLRRRVELDGTESLRLLGSVSLGRIVLTRHALPTIRPVNHIVDRGDIIIRTHDGTALTQRTREAHSPGVVVAYEADDIDPRTHLGWSVVVTGYAQLISDPLELDRYRSMLLPWVEEKMEHAVRVHPDLVTGMLLVPADGAPADQWPTPG
ncbi:pyridoxamine 5'-phosphate oxidase family protein [Streptomyces sp. 891-h]|uniref:pyridoxamine 5'-phosphate oxidase family protein n=1 Tax=Streptomyces sp. 891-h TaxID=2720714 RepID=UPI001FAAF845|nr:pyridoxamine 5'-phosphate oxidase family protein [Streptomyces sp. 891-h]UNZ16000.1 pyridoxamine 5'-phosphate oxidase family protein [Streptomyces sp. 891-h]